MAEKLLQFIPSPFPLLCKCNLHKKLITAFLVQWYVLHALTLLCFPNTWSAKVRSKTAFCAVVVRLLSMLYSCCLLPLAVGDFQQKCGEILYLTPGVHFSNIGLCVYKMCIVTYSAVER